MVRTVSSSTPSECARTRPRILVRGGPMPLFLAPLAVPCARSRCKNWFCEE
jgi:hypothetical protein